MLFIIEEKLTLLKKKSTKSILFLHPGFSTNPVRLSLNILKGAMEAFSAAPPPLNFPFFGFFFLVLPRES